MKFRRIVLLSAALMAAGSYIFAQPPVQREGSIVTENIGPEEVYTAQFQEVLEADTLEKVRRSNIFTKIGDYFKDSNEDKSFDKKFDFSFIGGPHYTSDVGFGIGVMAAGLYRIDRTDFTLPPSNISIFGDVATSGFFLLGVSGYNYFNQGKFRIDYSTVFFSKPGDIWGIGYEMGKNDDNKSGFSRDQVRIKSDFMYRVANNVYVGANAGFYHIRGYKFDNISLIQGQDKKYLNTGVGLFFAYDSRDVVTEPRKGIYLKLENVFFPKFIGNKPSFNQTEFTFDAYHKVWPSAILAWDVHAIYGKGDVPWTMLARMGGSKRMRGYYEGRYRDKGLAEAQVELRQKIWRRIGGTAWVGAGNVFNSPKNIEFSHTLPSYGLGFRWEFKSRINVRLDYGFGKNTSGFIFNINEAF